MDQLHNVEGLVGGASTADHLTATDTANTWRLAALHRGTLNGAAFDGMEHLTAGLDLDWFFATPPGDLLTDRVNPTQQVN